MTSTPPSPSAGDPTRSADRAVRVSTRALLIITLALAVALLMALGVAWWVTYQPPLVPVDVPSVRTA